jgi:hypothetical protein
MPKIGNITATIWREESETTGELVAALCAAHPEFPPIKMDSDGFRNGEAYRYASVAAIRRAVMPALAKHGVWMQHIYSESTENCYTTTVLRHTSGEYITSTLLVPPIADIQERKGAMTLLCRTCIEGLLSISTEEDTDAQAVSESTQVDAETRKRQEQNLALAEAAIALAGDDATLTRYVEVAKRRVESGDMAPHALDRIKSLCESRSKHLNKESDRGGDETTAGDQGPDAAGSGSGEPNRGPKRRAAGVGA